MRDRFRYDEVLVRYVSLTAASLIGMCSPTDAAGHIQRILGLCLSVLLVGTTVFAPIATSGGKHVELRCRIQALTLEAKILRATHCKSLEAVSDMLSRGSIHLDEYFNEWWFHVCYRKHMLLAAVLLAMDFALACGSACFRMCSYHASLGLVLALTMRYQLHSFAHPQRAWVMGSACLGRFLPLYFLVAFPAHAWYESGGSLDGTADAFCHPVGRGGRDGGGGASSTAVNGNLPADDSRYSLLKSLRGDELSQVDLAVWLLVPYEFLLGLLFALHALELSGFRREMILVGVLTQVAVIGNALLCCMPGVKTFSTVCVLAHLVGWAAVDQHVKVFSWLCFWSSEVPQEVLTFITADHPSHADAATADSNLADGSATTPPPSPSRQPARECVVCLTKPATHVFVPCGHMCVCRRCGDMVMIQDARIGSHRCPLCREPASTHVRVYT